MTTYFILFYRVLKFVVLGLQPTSLMTWFAFIALANNEPNSSGHLFLLEMLYKPTTPYLPFTKQQRVKVSNMLT